MGVLCGCTASSVDSSDDSSTLNVQAGTYIIDGTYGSTQRTHEEWDLGLDSTVVIRHFLWNSTSESGCYDVYTYSGTWSDSSLTDTTGRIIFHFSGHAYARSSCDSAWRDTTSVYSGKHTYSTRADSLGFDMEDSTSTWHTMMRM